MNEIRICIIGDLDAAQDTTLRRALRGSHITRMPAAKVTTAFADAALDYDVVLVIEAQANRMVRRVLATIVRRYGAWTFLVTIVAGLPERSLLRNILTQLGPSRVLSR